MIYFKQNIKFLRKKYKLSQTELGYLLGISRNGVSALETRETYPSFELLLKIRKIFNINLDDLIFKNLKE